VVGGSAVAIQNVPWAARMTFATPTSNGLCTGSVVDALHVVTAAHCVYLESGEKVDASQVTVDAGISNYATPAAGDLPQKRAVAAVRIHPDYRPSAFPDRDDVAVLVLAAPLDLSGPAVKAVSLPAAGTAFPTGASVTIAGFGQQSILAQPSGQLLSLGATVEAQGDCGEDGDDLLWANGVVYCMSTPAGTLCRGDSGSGVVAGGVLLGVVNTVYSSFCEPGADVGVASLLAPEILAFVQGSDAPPTAPLPAAPGRLLWKGPVRVGSTLTCSAGSGWISPVTATYAFVTADSGRVLQSGPKPTYVIAKSALHASIRCRALAVNAGGTLLVKTNASPNVAAAPAKKPKPAKKR
jgi:hypothetical protein